MKTKLIITLLLFQFTLNVFGQESATQEIKDNVAKQFNQWLKKGEFEKTTEYEARIKNANDTLEKLTQNVIAELKSSYIIQDMRNIYYKKYKSVSSISYNADDETFLMRKVAINSDYDSITIKVSPKLAKYFESNPGYNEIAFLPNEVQIISDKWVVTGGILVGTLFNGSLVNIQGLKKIGEDYFVTERNDKPVTYNFKNPKSEIGIQKFEADEKDPNNKHYHREYFTYEWKIAEQPTFNASAIIPVKLNLEDLNITLPTFNTETASTPKPQVPDLDMNSVKTTNSNPTAFAVVIGNKDYQYTKKVSYALNDAETMKKYLVNVLGYSEGNIFYIENATKSTFETYFGNKENPDGKLFNNIKPGVTDVFIYYAGHGAPGLKDNKGYFVPVDCEPQYVQQGGYSLDLFYANIAKLNAKSVTVVTDACFSGAEIFKDISPITITISNPIAVADNCVVLSSSAGSQVSSWYNDKQHGMFTYFFLKALQDKVKSDKNKDGKLTYEEIYEYVSDNSEGVPFYARSIHGVDQTPTIQGSGKNNTFIEYK
ncbi:MAG: caspase family protein [Paludibacter sp.]